jgi:hypothetical protein
MLPGETLQEMGLYDYHVDTFRLIMMIRLLMSLDMLLCPWSLALAPLLAPPLRGDYL